MEIGSGQRTREKNIAIKGINWKGNKDIEKGKEWAQKFIKEKIDVEVISWRMSGPVVIIKVDNEKMKREMIKNKNKLRGGKIFFENDLNFDERKMWVKAQENKGEDIKIRKEKRQDYRGIYSRRKEKLGIGIKLDRSNIDYKEKKVVIISVYNRGSWKNLEEKKESILGDMENEEIIVISGDFNVRIEVGIEKELVDWAQRKRWYILNGNRMDSNHMPLLSMEEEERQKSKEEEKKQGIKEIIVWNE
ncbi:hypothetical protein ALC53_05453 [Atta colombica]|uniref:Endonuclease/exonuclease/phosphatase domain-containing protein n=1 Tax=Atta colombica TaxID=520822 RepID=A0A195BHT2_9HYME|nr:hypothetical protein ALC53_05453 [Atta colombica]